MRHERFSAKQNSAADLQESSGSKQATVSQDCNLRGNLPPLVSGECALRIHPSAQPPWDNNSSTQRNFFCLQQTRDNARARRSQRWRKLSPTRRLKTQTPSITAGSRATYYHKITQKERAIAKSRF